MSSGEAAEKGWKDKQKDRLAVGVLLGAVLGTLVLAVPLFIEHPLDSLIVATLSGFAVLVLWAIDRITGEDNQE